MVLIQIKAPKGRLANRCRGHHQWAVYGADHGDCAASFGLRRGRAPATGER